MSPSLAQLTTGADAAGGAVEFWVFVVAGAIALGSAIAMVAMRNAVHAALMLVINLFAIAVLYAVMQAQFLAVIQLIVYAGAIMVLFLFVLMLLGVARDQSFTSRRHSAHTAVSIGLGVVLFAALFGSVAAPFMGPESVCGSQAALDAQGGLACVGFGTADTNVSEVGLTLFTDFVWPFEVTSALLVIAAIGAIVLGRRSEQPGDLVDRGTQTRPSLPDVHPAGRGPARPARDAEGGQGAGPPAGASAAGAVTSDDGPAGADPADSDDEEVPR